LTVVNSAECIKKESGTIALGQRANAVLFNKNIEKTITNQQSLYDGESIFGDVVIAFKN